MIADALGSLFRRLALATVFGVVALLADTQPAEAHGDAATLYHSAQAFVAQSDESNTGHVCCSSLGACASVALIFEHRDFQLAERQAIIVSTANVLASGISSTPSVPPPIRSGAS